MPKECNGYHYSLQGFFLREPVLRIIPEIKVEIVEIPGRRPQDNRLFSSALR
jgi:hypothetical protein